MEQLSINLKSKVKQRVLQMGASLLSEGYRFVINFGLPGSHYIKMKHSRNGNIITIIGRYENGEITVKRNGRVRHQEIVSNNNDRE